MLKFNMLESASGSRGGPGCACLGRTQGYRPLPLPLYTGCPNKHGIIVMTFISSLIHAAIFHEHNYCSIPAQFNV